VPSDPFVRPTDRSRHRGLAGAARASALLRGSVHPARPGEADARGRASGRADRAPPDRTGGTWRPPSSWEDQ